LATSPQLLPAVDVVTLVAGGRRVEPPEQIVYSNAPTSWLDSNGDTYVVKDTAIEAVIAEAVATRLARGLGLAVPDFARKLALRDISPWLRRERDDVLAELAKITVFDIWVANHDRNLGNLLPPTDGKFTGNVTAAVAIDFEKAVAIRSRYPLVEASDVSPKRCWPSGDLGVALAGQARPVDFVDALGAVTRAEIVTAVSAVRNVIGPTFAWADSVVEALEHRKQRIQALTNEGWQ
jgi:hypothetical protein